MGVIIRQSIKATVFNYIGAFIGFLTTFFILTKFLQPEVIGLTKVMYEVAALVAGFAQLGTSASAMRFFPYFRNQQNGHNGFFFYLMLMPTIGSVLFIGVFLLLKNWIIDFFIEKSALLVDYFYWLIPLILFLAFGTVVETYANILMKIVVPKFIKEIGIRVMLLVVYFCYALGWIDLTGLVTGFVLVYGCAMLSYMYYVSMITPLSLKHDNSFIDKGLRCDIMRYTLVLIVGAIGGNIIPQLDIFMVSSNMGLGYAGIYTIAMYMGAVIEVPSRSISAISKPLAANALKDGDLERANQLYRQVALHQLMASSTLFLLIWINIDNIFDILPNGEVYETGKWVVLFIAMSRILATTLEFGGTLISFSKYYYWGLYITFFLTGLTIFTNSVFISRWGISGAALATFLTCVVSYTFQQWIVLRKVKGNPYSIGILKQILLVGVLFVMNECLPRWSDSPFIDGIYRTIPIGACWVAATYFLRTSESVRGLIGTILNRCHCRQDNH
ncbi:MAG: lipopolysaccharide biosynthesis protein [Odoribacter sp.]|nr:lipopolysaccharide biosynthesis protein [Odoribacter sp.]